MLLQDTLPFKYSIDEAASAATGRLVLRGKFQQADVENGNGRVYEREILEREIGRLGEDIERRRVTGELDHPANSDIKLSRASHIITGLEIREDGQVDGTLEILEDSPYGKQAAALARRGFEFGISSRGTGSTIKEGQVEKVGRDFRLLTFDLVHNPSTAGAHARAVVEAKESEETPPMGSLNETNDSENTWQSLKDEANQILGINTANLTEATVTAAGGRVERLIEGLDRLGASSASHRNSADRMARRLEEKMRSLEESDDRPPLLEDRVAASEVVVEEMLREMARREHVLREAFSGRIRQLRESLRREGGRAARAVLEARQLRNRYATAMEAGEQVMTRLREERRLREDRERLLERRRMASRRDGGVVESMRGRRQRYSLTEGEVDRRTADSPPAYDDQRSIFEELSARTGLR